MRTTKLSRVTRAAEARSIKRAITGDLCVAASAGVRRGGQAGAGRSVHAFRDDGRTCQEDTRTFWHDERTELGHGRKLS
jgi:hypothetical protein